MTESSRLCLVLERVPEEVHEPELVATLPLVAFDAFLPGHRLYGWVRLDADRLTDMLNRYAELRLVNVLVERLADGTTLAADEAVVRRDDLIAVRASGPQGAAARRAETVAHPALVDAEPYVVGGHLHAPHGQDPLARVRGPESMIPLTDAWIAYRSRGEAWRLRLGTIIVNRHAASRFRAVTAEELASAVPERAAAA